MIPAFAAIAALIASMAPTQPCEAQPTSPALDHVVVAVRDLEPASAALRRAGFTLKAGRLHANNLLNRHVKFRDGSSLELMTVQGAPGDAMARDYADLLTAAEGGVYVALTVPDVVAPAEAAGGLGLEVRRSASGGWSFVSFPPATPAAAVFFGAGTGAVRDPEALVRHRPEVLGLDEAWLEGGPVLGPLLERLGAKRCGTIRSPDGRVGERWALRRGAVVVLPAAGTRRPRVLGVILQTRDTAAAPVYVQGDFWIRYRPVQSRLDS